MAVHLLDVNVPPLALPPQPLAPKPARAPLTLRRVLEPLPFVMSHVVGIAGLFFVDASPAVWAVCGVLWFVRMFFITAGYHRYFSHRAFKTSRVFQFVLAFGAQTSAQRGVLWWAAHHRRHHKLSDQPGDPHSPRLKGFWMSHVGWLYAPGADITRTAAVRDLARFPELRFLNRFWWLPATLLAIATLTIWGVPGLLVGFFLSTVITWHTTFVINSLAHVIGRRRYDTQDDSRNNWFLALLTHGEGWHNNHHHDMHAARQGRRWYEIDVTYYGLVMLSWLGIVWDLKAPAADAKAVKAAAKAAPLPLGLTDH